MQDFRKLVDKVLNHSMQTFGEKVTFYPKKGGVYEVQAIFDNNFQVVDVETEHTISANQPALGINLNDITFEIGTGDEVKIRNTRFKVHEKQEDGQGGAVLLLHTMKVIDANKDTRAR